MTRAAFAGALLVLIAVGINAGLKRVPDARATIELRDVRPEPRREAVATVRLQPRDAADNANWLYLLGWQGRRDRVIDRLRRAGDGLYRSTRPMPLHGSWKVGLRLQQGRARGAVPVRLPADPELGPRGAELRAPARFTRRFDADSKIMLREQAANKSAWLWMTSIGVIFAFYAVFVGGLALGVARLGRRARDAGPAPAPLHR